MSSHSCSLWAWVRTFLQVVWLSGISEDNTQGKMKGREKKLQLISHICADGLSADPKAVGTSSLGRFWKELQVLHRHPCFVLNTFGCVPIQATVGAFTFWGPKVHANLFTWEFKVNYAVANSKKCGSPKVAQSNEHLDAYDSLSLYRWHHRIFCVGRSAASLDQVK